MAAPWPSTVLYEEAKNCTVTGGGGGGGGPGGGGGGGGGDGGSVMSRVALLVPRVAPNGLLSARPTVSIPSPGPSSTVVTVKVWEVTPGAKVRVPLAGL